MSKTKHIVREYFKYINEVDSKKAKRIKRWLDKDKLGSIVLCGDVFWIESMLFNRIPDYVYNDIVHWGEKVMGYKYLYNL